MKELKDLWRFEIYKRSGNKCARCGRPDNLNAHHIHGKKAYPAGRFLLSNGICVCRGCHFVAHHKPEEFRFFLIGLYGGEDGYRATYTKVVQSGFRFKDADFDYVKECLEAGRDIY